MLSGLLPCIAVAARPAFQTSEELLASILHCIIAKRDKKQKRRRSGPRRRAVSAQVPAVTQCLSEPHTSREGGRGGAHAGHAAPPLSVETKLSVALRFLAGASVEDLDRYGVERKSSIMGCCVWPVVGAIHVCPELEFRHRP
mmetsp:Transcript_27216/g.87405  ORF Transcript_27216/g.87405 Transcript_27216/m.87405 type:complete len:142 (-) Transcript_27216:277-702(-)